MKLEDAKRIGEKFLKEIEGHYERAELVGSIRRKRPEVKDIDILIILKDFKWTGKFFGKITQLKTKGPVKIVRLTFEGAKLDIYLADENTWETLKLIRTGSAEHNKTLCIAAKMNGWKLKANGEGLLDSDGNVIAKTEHGILERLLDKYVEPEDREA